MSLRPLILVLLGTCLSATAVASERRYNVEIVILENTDTRAGEFERWRPEVIVPEIEGAIALEGPVELAPMMRADLLTEAPEGFEPLPSEQRKLGGAIRKLQESGAYRVLRHLAWQQPALGEDEAPRIRVHNGESMTVRVPIKDFSELYALEAESGSDGTGADATASAATEGQDPEETPSFGADRSLRSGMQPLMRSVEIHPLDGTIRLVVSRYLHIYTDLYFTTPVEWTALPVAAPGSEGADVEQAANGTATETEAETADPTATGIATTAIARGPEGQPMLSYPFVQRRRMRSGELHYLDHPVLGLLIRVDRAEESDPAANAAQ